MPLLREDDNVVTIKFGGGQNSSASEDDILANECASGQNFALNVNNKNLRPRKPIRKMGVAPNGQEIRGFANLVNSDGDITLLVQAGTSVYNWSETIGWIPVGTVSATAKLRGGLQNYWALDDYVIITDLNLQEKVWTWDGSAFTAFTENLAGDFKAKYCWIDNERVWFGNVISNSVATPHMIVASKLSDANTLSIANRPSSALGADDPFYVLTPDLRPVNGMIGFYDKICVSTDRGSIFQIVGSDSNDMQILKFYPRSGATGDESFQFVGNDIFYGRLGRLESLVTTDKSGDIASNDVTTQISDEIENLYDWQIAYNQRTQKIYIHAISEGGENVIYQYSKDMEGGQLSPWVRITTDNSFACEPTAMMSLINPTDGLEYTFMGDDAGNLYVMEGVDGEADAGENDITTTWRSGLLKLDNEMIAQRFTGHVSYRSGVDTEITIRFLFGGSYVSTDTITVPLAGSSGGVYFGGEVYFGGSFYFGVAFDGRFRRETIKPAGRGEEFQIEVSHTGTVDFEINEIVLRFESSTDQ